MENRGHGPVLSGVLIGGAIVMFGLTFGAVARIGNDASSVSLVAVVMTTIGASLLAALWPRAGSAGAIAATFALVPVVFFGAAWALSTPLVTTQMRCGTGDMGLVVIAPAVLLIGLAVATPFAFLVRRVPRAPLFLAAAMLVANLIVVAFAVVSLRHPEPDKYQTTFDGHAMLSANSSVQAGRKLIKYSSDGKTCNLQASENGAELPSASERIESETCEPVDVIWSSKNNLVLVGASTSGTRAIYGTATRYGNDLIIRDLAGMLGTPRLWVFGGVFGFFASLVAFALALRSRKQMRDTQKLIEGDHVGDGWVKVDDASPPQFIPELATRDANKVIVVSASKPVADYRNAPPPIVVREETRESLREKACARMIAWSCVAIAAACTSAAPLWAARLFGLL